MTNDWTRFLALCVIWGVFCALAMTTLIMQGTDANFIILGVMAFAAWMSTDSVMNNGKKDSKEESNDSEKTKRGSNLNSNALLSLLDEDDIADLRVRVKNRLMDSIERGSDGELSSLDQLLADQDTNRRRR
jgi:hypothetical protein